MVALRNEEIHGVYVRGVFTAKLAVATKNRKKRGKTVHGTTQYNPNQNTTSSLPHARRGGRTLKCHVDDAEGGSKGPRSNSGSAKYSCIMLPEYTRIILPGRGRQRLVLYVAQEHSRIDPGVVPVEASVFADEASVENRPRRTNIGHFNTRRGPFKLHLDLTAVRNQGRKC